MREPRPLRLSERLQVERAIDAAFAPLRAAHADLSPLRVRAAVRWGRGAPRPTRVRWTAVAARLSELSVAVGMTAMVLVGALAPARSAPRIAPPVADPAGGDPAIYPVPHVTQPLEDERYIRWLRLDRYVPLQDWLDPTVVRVGAPPRLAGRTDPPAPWGSDANSPF